MKTNRIFNGFFVSGPAIILIFCITFASPCQGGDVDKTTVKAYELRMQGKVDEAKRLLDQAISENPDNACAHYELARIQFHIALGTGNVGETMKMIGHARESIERAIALEPQNATYRLLAGHVYYLQAYYALMRGDISKEQFDKMVGAYQTVLNIRPDYSQAALYLVELYSQFPEDAGGNASEAERYAKHLDETDNIFAAKARSILFPQEADKVEYWQDVLKKNKGNADVLEELGKAYLGAGKVEDAVSYFEKVIEIDPEKAYLFLDLSIYYSFQGMQAQGNKELLQSSIEKGDAAVTRYLQSNPIQPMRAYALGVKAKYNFISGHQEQGQALLKEAMMLDPHFSKATAAPDPVFFTRPDEISHRHRYLLRPF
ncbi:MAG: tetratricopeptide repeat protein [Deltaproteobacteria bacterium]|nr:tetratricopeptide repeat protein [Deltaproteobacteria bacterium]